MTRAEHLQWCKTRALEYVERGQLTDAVASMMSDLRKHPETALPGSAEMLTMVGVMDAMRGDTRAVRRWVEGFN